MVTQHGGGQGSHADAHADHAAARRSLGLTLVFATAAIWIVSSFLSASLVSSHDEHKAAVHPFLLTYLATSLFTLYLPLLWLKDWATRLMGRGRGRGGAGGGGAAGRHGAAAALEVLQHCSTQSPRSSFDGIEVAAHKMGAEAARNMAMRAAAWSVPLWFCAQWAFNVSLSLTSVTSNTILSSTSSLFTFFLSILLLGEAFSSRKLAAIAACIVGTALVTVSDSKSADSGGAANASLEGDLLTVSAAALYAGYTVVMRKQMPGEEAEEHVAAFFGYVGLFSTIALAPVVLLATSLGVFSFASIPREAYVIIVLEGMLDYVLSDYLWARAVMLLGPTVATAGLSVQIPLAAATDLLLGNAGWAHSAATVVFTLGGTTLILGGFFYINLASSDTDDADAAGRAGDDASDDEGSGGAQAHEAQGLLRSRAAAAGAGGQADAAGAAAAARGSLVGNGHAPLDAAVV
ncbi:hypothetical protein FOA52_006000 [Chlamydomonas sp. UWO 241]|nr:hypothetical protein FOA52_006000 [Chlamydomonas sp. UWO 241]